MMTDHDIVQGLISRDERVTREFFFQRCRPLFMSIIQQVFPYDVDYDEVVNELYLYLLADDGARLRSFGFRCSLYQWIKVIAIRYLIKKRDRLIENASQETLYIERASESESAMMARSDVERLFSLMPNQRYVHVIRRLVLEEQKPEQLAEEMNITAANLYNIRRRAMAQLTRVALQDVHRTR